MDKKSLLAALKEKIAQAESKGDYNAYNQGRANPKSGDISSLTLEELMKRQALAKGDSNRVFAAGKYQMIPKTLKEAVEKLKLNNKDKFSPEIQEKLFDYIINQKRPSIGKFIEGKASPEEASMALAKEWASMPVLSDTERNGKPVKRGESYYSGIGGNKAKVSPEALESLLNQYKSMKNPVAPIVKQDPIQKEQDAAFEKMLSQPQIPLVADNENDFADGGFEETNVFPYRPEEPEQADDIAQTRETGLPEQTKALEMPDVDTSIPDSFESKTDQAPVAQPKVSSAEATLNRIMELRKKQKEETDKEYADKESSAKWKDVLGTAMGGLDKAFAHYGAANPNAILKPVHLEQEKQDRLEKVQGEKAGTLKDREKVIEDIMSQELKASSRSTLSNDPDSEASVRARAFASEMGLEIPENATELMINKVINTAIGRKTAQESSAGKADRFDRGLEFRKETEGRKRTEKDEGDAMNTLKMLKQSESWKSAEKTLAEVPTLKLLLNDARDQGGQSLAMLGPKIAKSIAGEVGVLTEADVTRYVKDPALARSLMDSYTKLSQGKLTDTSYENLMRLVDLSEMAAKDKINKVVDDGAELYSRRSGLSKEQARYLLDNEYKKPVAPKVKIKQKASGRIKAFLPEEAQRLLMEKPDEYEEVK